MFARDEYTVSVDWFEGTLWPELPVDRFVEVFCDEVFSRPADEICTWVPRGWQGYSGRVEIGGNDKLCTLYFRKGHSVSNPLSDDFINPVVPCDDAIYGIFFDIHIVVTGSGLRFLGNDGACRLMSFFADKTFVPSVDPIPRFRWDFKPTRIDVCCDIFKDNGFIDTVQDAFLCEYNHGCFGDDYKGENRFTCPSKVSTLCCHMQKGSNNWTWGSRGSSNFYFRLYDKALEQEIKNGPLKGRHEYWWRFEYECRFMACLNVALQLIYGNSVGSAFTYCLDNYLVMVEDRYDNHNKSANPVSECWIDFYSLIAEEYSLYKRQYVVEPYTIIHLVEKEELRNKKQVLFAYIADPFAFNNDKGYELLQKLRKDPNYKSIMLRLDAGILTYDEFVAVSKMTCSRGVSPVWGFEF